jgi:glycosyltransferase involved in cell wall biosynthesis
LDLELTSLNLTKITILVTSHNKKEFLGNLISLAKEVDLAGGHLVVIDDGSTDGSTALIREILQNTDRQILILTPNYGSAAARNLAMSYVRTEFFMFCDLDDQINLVTLSNALSNVVSEPKVLYRGEYAVYHSSNSSDLVYNNHSSSLGSADELVHSLGYWRFIYPTIEIQRSKIRFLPTFQELGGKRFILDDLYWMLQLAALNLEVKALSDDHVLYLYFRPQESKTLDWNNYLRQVTLMPTANKVLLLEILKNPNLDKSWILEKSQLVLIEHLRYLDLKWGLRTITKFVAQYILYHRNGAQIRLINLPRIFLVLVATWTKNSLQIRNRFGRGRAFE